MPKRYNNTIYKLSLRIKKTIKAILSSITRIGLIIYIEDFKEAFNINYIYINIMGLLWHWYKTQDRRYRLIMDPS